MMTPDIISLGSSIHRYGFSRCRYILIENLNGVLQYANILSRLKGTNRNDNDQEEAVDFSEPITTILLTLLDIRLKCIKSNNIFYGSIKYDLLP